MLWSTVSKAFEKSRKIARENRPSSIGLWISSVIRRVAYIVEWYYSRWEDSYKVMQSSIGEEIQFIRGLPEFKEDLRQNNPKFNNALVFDDLMASNR